MRFSANRLYIEAYEKCPNCGVLLYDNSGARASWVIQNGKTYCSQWCVTWEADRAVRRASAPTS